VVHKVETTTMPSLSGVICVSFNGGRSDHPACISGPSLGYRTHSPPAAVTLLFSMSLRLLVPVASHDSVISCALTSYPSIHDTWIATFTRERRPSRRVVTTSRRATFVVEITLLDEVTVKDAWLYTLYCCIAIRPLCVVSIAPTHELLQRWPDGPRVDHVIQHALHTWTNASL